MANIILRDDKGDFKTYEDVKTVSFNNDSGTFSTYSEDVEKTVAWYTLQKFREDPAFTKYTFVASYGTFVSSTDTTFGVWLQTELDAIQLVEVGSFNLFREQYGYVYFYSSVATGTIDAPTTGAFGIYRYKAGDEKPVRYCDSSYNFTFTTCKDSYQNISNIEAEFTLIYSTSGILPVYRGLYVVSPFVTDILYVDTPEAYTAANRGLYTTWTILNDTFAVLSASSTNNTGFLPALLNFKTLEYQHFPVSDTVNPVTSYSHFNRSCALSATKYIVYYSTTNTTSVSHVIDISTGINKPLPLATFSGVYNIPCVINENVVCAVLPPTYTLSTYNILTDEKMSIRPNSSGCTYALYVSEKCGLFCGSYTDEYSIKYGSSSFSGSGLTLLNFKTGTFENLSTTGYYGPRGTATYDGSLIIASSCYSTVYDTFAIDTDNVSFVTLGINKGFAQLSLSVIDERGATATFYYMRDVYFSKPDTVFYVISSTNNSADYGLIYKYVKGDAAPTPITLYVGSQVYCYNVLKDTTTLNKRFVSFASCTGPARFFTSTSYSGKGIWLAVDGADDLVKVSETGYYYYYPTNTIDNCCFIISYQGGVDYGIYYVTLQDGEVVFTRATYSVSSNTSEPFLTKVPEGFILSAYSYTYVFDNTGAFIKYVSTTGDVGCRKVYYTNEVGDYYFGADLGTEKPYLSFNRTWFYANFKTNTFFNVSAAYCMYTFFVADTGTGALFSGDGTANAANNTGVWYFNKVTGGTTKVCNYGNQWQIYDAPQGTGLFYLYRPNYPKGTLILWNDNTKAMTEVLSDV